VTLPSRQSLSRCPFVVVSPNARIVVTTCLTRFASAEAASLTSYEVATGKLRGRFHSGNAAGAIKVAVHRLRSRYRELLRAEIGQTVAGPEEIEQEIRDLFTAISS